MTHRIAIGSCSNPSLPQPLWKIIRARRPAAFVWGGDAVYSDRHAGFNWTAVGLHRVHDENSANRGGWMLTFPPPSIHIEATPDTIRGRYVEQLSFEDYRCFVQGWRDPGSESKLTRPIIYGTVDDHDYGQNNGDSTYQYRWESNLAFVDFLYSDVSHENDKYCAQDVATDQRTCSVSQHGSKPIANKDIDEETIFASEGKKGISCTEELMRVTANKDFEEGHDSYTRKKERDPMYQRALEGKGVYGVQLFDFSQSRNSSWGGGHWVPVEEAMIDPDVATSGEDAAEYSATHSVAIFVLDVRSNKTPWPNGKQKAKEASGANSDATSSAGPAIDPPAPDFLGGHQWEWFRSALKNSRAAANVIVSGLQVHPERFPNNGNILEEWSKFPEARQMLYDAILNSGASGPLLVSGDVHMSEIMRKDCIRSSDIPDGSSRKDPERRPLVEITTSGMTHSWGNSFSSQPRLHRLPWKLWSYLVSPTFMTIAHCILPLNDLVIRTAEDARKETDGSGDARGKDGTKDNPGMGGKLGKQFYLGLNFLDLEFEFDGRGEGLDDKGAVVARIFGREPNAPPKLEMRWTFGQLSGKEDLPGTTATADDYLNAQGRNFGARNPRAEDRWICVPYRGLPSTYHEYAANTIMLLTFCFLFFLPHGLVVLLLIVARRLWFRHCSRVQ